ncbi:MAG: tetratricopeptide repeat protein [Sphingomicrobium sp.]
MTGLFIVLLIVALAVALLWLMGMRGGALSMAGAILMFGAAGYAFQGHPDLPGAPRSEGETSAPIPLDKVRRAFMGNFSASEHWLIMADSFAARGDTQGAVGLLKSAVKEHPRDYGLWVGLGNALADHARSVTPASRLAFQRAKEIAPSAPAPDYFLGLALLRSGQPDEALTIWKKLLAESDPRAQWRSYLVDGVTLIEGMQAAPVPAPPTVD